jgi:glycosyltransferase involved in cell wall biosynthesis
VSGKRAAHFIGSPYLVDNPSNHSLISALLEHDFTVDVFSSDPSLDLSHYGPKLSAHHAQYGYRWLAANLIHPRWLRYSLFSGTTEDPMAAAGLLATIYRQRCVTVADEIKSGGTSGNRAPRWKALCRFGMRAADLTIVNEKERVEVQRAYAGLPPSHPIMVVPNCFRDPPRPGDRQQLRRERGFPEDALVVCFSGVFSAGNGALWYARALAERTDTWFWGQVVPQEPMVADMLPLLRGAERLFVEPGPLGWRFPWASMPAADIGVVVYLHDAPQFRHMGVASNRLCMFLTMGVPVIASRQPSFQFVEDYDCGVLVESAEEFVRAIDIIRPRLAQMRANAMRCSREYIDAMGSYKRLLQSLALVGA